MTKKDNYVYLAMTAHFWGAAKSERDALRNVRGAGGARMLDRYGYVLYRVHPDFEVSGVNGDVMTPVGHPAIKVKDAMKKKRGSNG